MYGGGSYKLVSIKEIKTTDSFHSLRDDQKKCQTLNTLEECFTNLLLQMGKDKCGCTPYELLQFSGNNTVDATICDSSGIDCYHQLSVDKSNCLMPCEGIFADIWKENVDEVTANHHGMKNIFEAYENYKNQFIVDLNYPIAILGMITMKFVI